MSKTTKKDLGSNIDGPSVLKTGNIGTTWWNISYQTKPGEKGGYVDQKELPRVFVLGQGKRVLRLSMTEALGIKKLFESERDVFLACLRDERAKLDTTEEF